MAVNSENYVVIPGWAVNKFNLRGNDLLVYSIIYGFSQTEGQFFKGGLPYLSDWTNSTKQGVLKNLNNLEYWGYIKSEEHKPTNWYYANLSLIKEFLGTPENKALNSVQDEPQSLNSVNESVKLSITSNIKNTKNNINNSYLESLKLTENIEEIISYLNTICNTNFRYTASETKRLIKARLKEGFTIQDFKLVIDCKYNDWGKTPIKFATGQMSNEYLRPSTLFGDKFESYLHEAKVRSNTENNFNSISTEIDPDRADISF